MTNKTKVTWVALATDFYRSKTSLILRSMPDGDSLMFVWTMILALAGELNEGGALIENGQPMSINILANFFQKKERILAKYFQIFTEKDMIFCENSTYYIVNWDKYQNVNSLDKIRENSKSRVKKFRDKQSENVTLHERYSNVTCNASVVINNTSLRIRNKERSTEIKEIEGINCTSVQNDVFDSSQPSDTDVKYKPLPPSMRYVNQLIKHRYIAPDDLYISEYEHLFNQLIMKSSAKKVGIKLHNFLQNSGLKFAHDTNSDIPSTVQKIGDRYKYFESVMYKGQSIGPAAATPSSEQKTKIEAAATVVNPKVPIATDAEFAAMTLDQKKQYYLDVGPFHIPEHQFKQYMDETRAPKAQTRQNNGAVPGDTPSFAELYGKSIMNKNQS